MKNILQIQRFDGLKCKENLLENLYFKIGFYEYLQSKNYSCSAQRASA